MNNLIRDNVKSISSTIINWRRKIHKMAELSFQEYKTSAFIEETLHSFGNIEISRPTPTSVLGVLKGKNKGKTIGFRADIDALAITEKNDIPYKSENEGVMHACGHDGHAAMLLGAAYILSTMQEEICGEIRFIFQHAEELLPGGASELVAAGVTEGLDEVYAIHLSSNKPTGIFEICPGVAMASNDTFKAIIKGKGGHSSRPHMCIDPLIIGAHYILSLQSIISRKISAFDAAVISACTINAGSANNVIPDELEISGSIRTFSKDVREQIPNDMEKMLKGVSEAHDAEWEFAYTKGYSSVVNDNALSNFAKQLIIDSFGKDHVEITSPRMSSEDFSALESNCPGLFIGLGSGSIEKGTMNLKSHHPYFNIDEDALLIGTEFWVLLANAICKLKNKEIMKW